MYVTVMVYLYILLFDMLTFHLFSSKGDGRLMLTTFSRLHDIEIYVYLVYVKVGKKPTRTCTTHPPTNTATPIPFIVFHNRTLPRRYINF